MKSPGLTGTSTGANPADAKGAGHCRDDIDRNIEVRAESYLREINGLLLIMLPRS